MHYVVQRGDSPARTAQKLTGTTRGMGQLLAANPHKVRALGLGGFETFQSISVGERLNVPRGWGGGSVSSVNVEKQALATAAGNAPSADPDGSYHGSVVAYQTAGAVAASQLGPDIDSTYGAANTSSNTSLATALNATLQAVNSGDGSSSNPASLSDAQTAQNYLSQMLSDYNAAILAAGGGGGGPGQNAVTTAANNAVAAINGDSNYCADVGKAGTSVNSAVHAFKAAWNAAGKTPTLPYNGQYDQTTQAAIISLGIVAPNACNAPPPPAGCSTGQVKDSVTGACVSPCSDGSIPANGACPVAPPVTSQASSGNALVAGVLLVGLGGAAVAYAVKRRKR